MLKDLNLKSLGDLDGGAAILVIDAAIAAAVADLEDRGLEDGKERLVKIVIKLTKVAKDTTSIVVTADPKLPERKVAATTAVTRFSRVNDRDIVNLSFQALNPERPDQPTFPAMETLDTAGGEVPND